MKKWALATMLGLILLAGSLGLFSGNSNEAKLDSNLPVIHNAKSMDFKTGIVAPDKTGIVNKEAIIAKATTIAVPFVKNVGQFHKEVKYAADLFAGRFFLTDKELVYSILTPAGKKGGQPEKPLRTMEPRKNATGKGLAVREYFLDKKGTRISFSSTGEQQAATKVSYFKGNDPSQWRSGVASYQGVSLGEVYPGVKVKLKASGKNVEKIFYLSPRTDVADIKIGVAGIAGLEIANDGRLLLKNSLGKLAMRAPIAWQEINGQHREVKVNYRLLGKKQYGFAVSGNYEKNHALVIDPELDALLASTFLGGNDYDIALSLALDNAGNVYVTGETESLDFPMTSGTFEQNLTGKGDAYISKLNNDLTVLLASTFLGGNDTSDGWELGRSLALDNAGNVYVTGWTDSSDFPTTPGAFDRTYNGGTYGDDAFVSKLTSDLTTLLASTYLGGNDDDSAYSLVLDGANNIYLTGITESSDFPITPGAYISTHYNNAWDIFVSKFTNDLATLLASTYLGGSGVDRSVTLVLDNTGSVYLTGWTGSTDFPTTPGAFDRSYIYPDEDGLAGSSDIFVAKMNENLTSLLASTFLSGNGDMVITQRGFSLALDSAGNVLVTGHTASAAFPTTLGAYDRTFNENSDGDAFVSKLSSDLTTLLASTFLGGGGSDVCISLALDKSDNVFVTGDTSSTDFPTTPGAFDREFNGNSFGFFIAKMNPNLNMLLASTYLGDNNEEVMPSCFLDLDNADNVFVTGYTSSTDFPTTRGAFDRTHNGRDDAFVAKLNERLPNITVTIASPNGGESWMEGSIQNVTWTSTGFIANVNIDYSIDDGVNWIQVAANIANNEAVSQGSNRSGNGDPTRKTAANETAQSFAWTVPPTPSTLCRVRISDAANALISDASDAVFSILMNLDLQAERREVKSFSMVKHFGQIHFLEGYPDVPISEYRIMRRKGSDAFMVLRTVLPSELQNNQFQMQDKYLEKNIQYTYLVEVYNAAGQLVGHSAEKTI